MDAAGITQSPFAVLTFIVAPALLTNASSVLALSTINRMLRTRDRMHEMFLKSEAGGQTTPQSVELVKQVNRVEQQALLLLGALRSVYVALGAFVSSTLVTLLGAGLAAFHEGNLLALFSGIGVLLGFVGVGGLVFGCWNLFHATRLSLINIREEAALIRIRQEARESAAAQTEEALERLEGEGGSQNGQPG